MSDVCENSAANTSVKKGGLYSDADSASPSHVQEDPDSEELGSDSGSDEDEDEDGDEDGDEAEDEESNGDIYGLLDLEASESGSDKDEDDHDESGQGSRNGKPVSFWSDYKFPQFANLPPELRCRVWELFSPMVYATSRVVPVNLRMIGEFLQVDPEVVLVQQYESVATLLKVNHESRDIVLKALPDTLAVWHDDCSIVRFNRSKDVVGLVILEAWEDWMEPDPLRPENARHYQIPGFSEHVERLSLLEVNLDERGLIINPHDHLGDPAHIFGLLMSFPNLKAVYNLTDSKRLPLRSMHWCAQEDSTHSYDLRITEENEYDVEIETRLVYVWPDVDKFTYTDSRDSLPEIKDFGVWADEFQEYNPPDISMPSNFQDGEAGDIEFPMMISEVLGGIEYWPMIQFRGKSGYKRLQRLIQASELENLDESEDDDSESDGGDWVDMDDGNDLDSEDDDGEMDDFIEHDEFDQADNSDARQDDGWNPDNSADADEDDLDLGGDGQGVPLFNGFSPTQDSSGAETDEFNDNGGNGAHLYPGDLDESPRPSKKRKARRVIDTDDEEDEDQDIRPAKIQRRSRRVVAPDSEDEDQGEDGSDNDDGAPVQDAKSPSSSDSDDQGATQGGGRSLTFAERLSLHRDENPIEDSDEDSSTNGDDSSDGGTAQIPSDDDNGEEDEDDDEDDDGSNGSNGMVDHYAEERYDDEDNGSDDDGGW